MGDFEDVFGEGADSDAIIKYYSDVYRRLATTNVARASYFGVPSPEELEHAELEDEYEAWESKMISRGYVQGPFFKSFEELDSWRKDNPTKPHVSRRAPIGRASYGFQVFFTDK